MLQMMPPLTSMLCLQKAISPRLLLWIWTAQQCFSKLRLFLVCALLMLKAPCLQLLKDSILRAGNQAMHKALTQRTPCKVTFALCLCMHKLQLMRKRAMKKKRLMAHAMLARRALWTHLALGRLMLSLACLTLAMLTQQ